MEPRSTKKLLVVQHVPYEILGTLDPLLRRAGFRIRYVNFSRHPHAEPKLEGYDGMIVLGGPMNLHQMDELPHLSREIALVEEAIERNLPTLGICLGAQLIAKALGASVHENPETEIGWYPLSLTEAGAADRLLGKLDTTEQIFQWHSDTFDIPAGAEHLATSPTCTNQAFRYGKNVYAFQFHLEVDAPMIERWITVPVHLEQIRSLNGQIEPERILADTPSLIGRLEQLSAWTFGEFISLVGHRKRHVVLPSR